MKVAIKKKVIEEILARKNKSQNWLAHRLEICGAYMSQIMTGIRNPSPRMRERIMKIFPDKKFDDLFMIKK